MMAEIKDDDGSPKDRVRKDLAGSMDEAGKVDPLDESCSEITVAGLLRLKEGS